VTLTSPTGVLATNVAAVKFDFTSPTSEHGYCGYNRIALFGIVNSNAVPITLSVVSGTGRTRFQMSVSGLSVGQSYTLQSTTNLTSAVWSAETNFVATQPAVALTNAIAGDAQKFYRLVEN